MKKPVAAVLLSHILWGLLPVFWKLLSAVNEWKTWYILFSRVVWSLLFIAVLILVGRSVASVKAVLHDRKELMNLALCGVLVTLNWGSYIYAVCAGHVMESSLAYYITPILSVLIGALFFRERLSGLQWLSAAIALCGVVYACFAYEVVPYLALFMAATFAAYGAFKKPVKCDSKTSLFFETLTVSPIALAYLVFCGLPPAMPYTSLPFVGTVAITGNFATVLTYILLPLSGVITAVPLLIYAYGVKRTDYSLSGMLMYINPTLQLILGLAYGEKLDKARLITFALVWIAMLLFLYENHRKRGKQDGKIKD